MIRFWLRHLSLFCSEPALSTEDVATFGEIFMQGAVTDAGPRTAGLDTTAITEALSQRIGSQKYRIWFQSCARFALADGTLRIGVANPFLATWLEGHFLKDIQAAAQSVTGSPLEISFTVDAELSGDRRRSPAAPGSPLRGIVTGGASRPVGSAPARASKEASGGVTTGGGTGDSASPRPGRRFETDIGYVCRRLVE